MAGRPLQSADMITAKRDGERTILIGHVFWTILYSEMFSLHHFFLVGIQPLITFTLTTALGLEFSPRLNGDFSSVVCPLVQLETSDLHHFLKVNHVHTVLKAIKNPPFHQATMEDGYNAQCEEFSIRSQRNSFESKTTLWIQLSLFFWLFFFLERSGCFRSAGAPDRWPWRTVRAWKSGSRRPTRPPARSASSASRRRAGRGPPSTSVAPFIAAGFQSVSQLEITRLNLQLQIFLLRLFFLLRLQWDPLS